MLKKNILITGGAGYIGSSLCTSLVLDGHNVTVIDKFNYDKHSLNHLFIYDNFQLIKVDLLKYKSLEKKIKENEYIIPLAALVGAPLCEKNRKLTIQTNLMLIKRIVSATSKKHKLIYPTTNSGYGVGEKKKFCDEKSPLKPVSLYGQTKNEAEKIIMTCDNWISFRLATVFGSSFRNRNDLMVNNFVYNAIKFKKITLYEPNFRRNFIHILDVVKAFSFSIKNFKKLKNNVYNLGLSSANITKLKLAKKVQKIIPEFKIKIKNNKKDPDQRDYFVSNAKIEKKGFKAKISLDKGIKEMKQVFSINKKISKNY